tara:strand:- start:4 stop:867 length:864 start_codon:yes stop_codon:yes gene_type:complete
MAFTSPFFQGTQAQGIIDNYVNAGGYNQSFPSPSTNPYRVNSSAFVPPSSQPEPDPDIPNCEEAYPGEGRVYDPVMNACVLPEVSTQPEGNDREVQEEPYQGVGSINSPTQNAFMNLGLGSEYFDPDDPNKKLDLYGSGISGAFKRFTPFGQLGVYLDAKRLADAGVINQRDGGGYSFAKGGNLNLVQANQAFEQDLARQQGLNLDAVSANPYIDQLGNEQFMVQSRGDKADNMSNNVYKDNNANVTISPFKSDYGAKEIVSYNKPKNTFTSKYNQSKQGNPFERNR